MLARYQVRVLLGLRILSIFLAHYLHAPGESTLVGCKHVIRVALLCTSGGHHHVIARLAAPLRLLLSWDIRLIVVALGHLLVLGWDTRNARHQIVPLGLLAYFLLHLLDRLILVSEIGSSCDIRLVGVCLATPVGRLRFDIASKRLVLLDVVGVLGLVVTWASVFEHLLAQVYTLTHGSSQR